MTYHRHRLSSGVEVFFTFIYILTEQSIKKRESFKKKEDKLLDRRLGGVRGVNGVGDMARV